jgi:hypothetical protein
MLSFDGQFADDKPAVSVGGFASTAVWLVIALSALNVVATLLECGFAACPDDPDRYELLRLVL